MHRITSTVLNLLLLALAGCAMQSPAPVGPVRITILHTNDHHGRFWKNNDGEYGLAAQKTVVDEVRAEVAAAGGYSLLLSGGDINTGVPESDLQDAVPDFKGMNLLAFDAMAVGNHEFDKPPAVLQMQRELARFPMLSANIYRGGSRMFEPYKLFTLGGVRIAVMGLTTEDTRKMVLPDHVRDIDFRSPIEEARGLVPQLRQQAEVVIAATHMGHYENGVHGINAPGDVEMARSVPGIDLIVGGHTQNPACMTAENQLDRAYVPGSPCTPDRQNGSWIVQAHEWGKYVGRADFEYRKGSFTLVRYALIPINLKKRERSADGSTRLVTYTPEIAEDPQMLALLSPHQQFGQQKLLVDVGSSDGRFEGDRDIVRSRPTNLGQLILRAMMERTGADFAVINGGGIRDSMPAGRLSYKDVLKVAPFGNTIATIDMSGQEVLAYLAATAKMSPGAGAFAHYAGVQMLVQGGQAQDVRIGGQPLQPGRNYRLAVAHFTAAGGDAYPRLNLHPGYRDTGFVDAEVLRSYIAARSPLRAADFDPGDAVQRK